MFDNFKKLKTKLTRKNKINKPTQTLL